MTHQEILDKMHQLRTYSAGLFYGLAMLTEHYDPSFINDWQLDLNDIASDYNALVTYINGCIKDKHTESCWLEPSTVR